MASALLRRSLRGFLLCPSTLPTRIQGARSLFSSSSSSSPALIFGLMTQQGLPKRYPSLPSVSSLRFASTSSTSKISSADDNLARVLYSEIECVQQYDSGGLEIGLPENFPFDIIDNPGDQAFVLKRELPGETIQVIVMNIDDIEGLDFEDNENNEDDEDDKDRESYMKPRVSLVVTVDKGDDSLLEFGCSLTADELDIESMVLKKHGAADDQGAYQGPEFKDLDENLQKSVHTYLQARGIRNSLFDFLHEYVQNKDEREYLVWLKNMKEFVK